MRVTKMSAPVRPGTAPGSPHLPAPSRVDTNISQSSFAGIGQKSLAPSTLTGAPSLVRRSYASVAAVRRKAQMSRPFVSAGPAAVYRNLPSRVSMGQPPGATATGEPHSGGGVGAGAGAGAGAGEGEGDGAGAGESSWPQPPSRPAVTMAARPVRKILFMLASLLEFFGRDAEADACIRHTGSRGETRAETRQNRGEA